MTTALIFHGLTGSLSDVEELRALLSQNGVTNHAVNLPAHRFGRIGTDTASTGIVSPQLPCSSIEDLCAVQSRDYIEAAEEAFTSVVLKRRTALTLIGLSFGALLSLHLTASFPALVNRLILVSPPFRARKLSQHIFLSMLGVLPELLLSKLPVIAKTPRSEHALHLPRQGHNRHSLGALVRAYKIRSWVLSELYQLRAPCALLYDPYDHLLSEQGIATFQNSYKGTSFTTAVFPGGQHELTLGPYHEAVCRTILDKVVGRAQDSGRLN